MNQTQSRQLSPQELLINTQTARTPLCRCKWCNLKNPLYIKYHDKEWGFPEYDDHMLFELLILESFQAGLSWECVLNKRDAFRKAFDNFNLETVCGYDDTKKAELLQNKDIIRNRLKINAMIYSRKNKFRLSTINVAIFLISPPDLFSAMVPSKIQIFPLYISYYKLNPLS